MNDIELMALCSWREARGEGLYGCILVMHVIYNRVGKPGFAHTIHDVIMGRNQFSSMDAGDPQFNLYPSSGDSIYAGCLAAAPDILAGGSDPTNGAVWYANEATATSGWYFNNIINSGNHPVTLQYKHHTFRS